MYCKNVNITWPWLTVATIILHAPHMTPSPGSFLPLRDLCCIVPVFTTVYCLQLRAAPGTALAMVTEFWVGLVSSIPLAVSSLVTQHLYTNAVLCTLIVVVTHSVLLHWSAYEAGEIGVIGSSMLSISSAAGRKSQAQHRLVLCGGLSLSQRHGAAWWREPLKESQPVGG